MKTLTCTLAKFSIALLLFITQAYAQSDNIVMTTKSMTSTNELADMMRFYDMDYYDVQFKGSDLKGKDYSVTVKEIWNGKIKNIDTIFTSATGEMAFLGKIKADTLSFRIAAAKKGNKTLKINFYFDRFGLSKEYKCTKSNDYSLRDTGTRLPIKANQPFYAFAYILPYKLKSGGSSWCAVDSSNKDIEKWGTEFGIKHYLLIEMNFTDAKVPTQVSKN